MNQKRPAIASCRRSQPFSIDPALIELHAVRHHGIERDRVNADSVIDNLIFTSSTDPRGLTKPRGLTEAHR